MVAFLGTLTAFNFGLRSVYRSGEYKKPFSGYDRADTGRVTELYLRNAERFNVQVRTGQYGLWIKKGLRDKVLVKREGGRLTVSFRDSLELDSKGYGDSDLILQTDGLSSLTTASSQKTAFWFSDQYAYGNVNLVGLSGDSLSLNIGRFTRVNVFLAKFGKLHAGIRGEGNPYGVLYLDRTSKLAQLDLNIPGAGSVEIDDTEIGRTNFNISDSAAVRLKGRALVNLRR